MIDTNIISLKGKQKQEEKKKKGENIKNL